MFQELTDFGTEFLDSLLATPLMRPHREPFRHDLADDVGQAEAAALEAGCESRRNSWTPQRSRPMTSPGGQGGCVRGARGPRPPFARILVEGVRAIPPRSGGQRDPSGIERPTARRTRPEYPPRCQGAEAVRLRNIIGSATRDVLGTSAGGRTAPLTIGLTTGDRRRVYARRKP